MRGYNKESMFFDMRSHVKPSEDNWYKVMIEVTDYCNLNCPFCLNSSSAANDEFLSLDSFKIIVDKIKSKAEYIQLSGGETLTNPDILGMIDYLIENQIPFCLNTNGTLMSNEIIERLVNYDKAVLQISLDGANEETDDFFRCKGHFAKVISVMNLLNERKFNKGVIKMVINRRNFEQIEDYFELAMKHNFMPTYALLMMSGRARDNWEDLNIDDDMRCMARDRIRKLLDDNKDYFKKYKDCDELLEYLRNMNIDYIEECTFNLDYFSFSPLICADGTVRPCQGLLQKEFSIGNMITQSPEDIFTHKNPLVEKLAKQVQIRRHALDNNLCKDCVLNNICGKGCVATSYGAGDFYGKPAGCGMRKRDFLKSMLMRGKR